MKRLNAIIILCILFIVGAFLMSKIAEIFPYTYNYEHDYYKPHGVKYYLLPPNSHVIGHVSSNSKFSVYIVPKDELEKFKHKDYTLNNSIYYINVSYVKLNITVPSKTCYLAVVNEEKRWQWITVEIKTKK